MTISNTFTLLLAKISIHTVTQSLLNLFSVRNTKINIHPFPTSNIEKTICKLYSCFFLLRHYLKTTSLSLHLYLIFRKIIEMYSNKTMYSYPFYNPIRHTVVPTL